MLALTSPALGVRSLAGPRAQPTPFSSNGCSLSVCINIDGSGLFVNSISVYDKGEGDLPVGTPVAIKVNGSTQSPGGIWSIGPVSYGIIVYYYYDFPNQASVCGEISGLPGSPCKKIHS